MKLLHPAILCLAIVVPAGAQSPSTDIFVADLRVAGATIEIGVPANVTNRAGYDNQPWFTRDGTALLYNAEIDAQTDIFRYVLATGARTQLTHTADNEYSPSITPAGELLVVRCMPSTPQSTPPGARSHASMTLHSRTSCGSP